MDEKILVLDFGGQYDLLIARRVRENHVYAEIKPYDRITPEEIEGYQGIIFTGGPSSVYAEDAPRCDSALLNLGIPILGICYGAQLMAWLEGGEIAAAETGSEYGKTTVYLQDSPLFRDIPCKSLCWMSHTDYIKTMPPNFHTIAHTDKCPCAAMHDPARKLYGVQFHPEVTHTAFGRQLIRNFLFEICGLQGLWKMEDFIETSVQYYREKLRGKKALCALSGGVDSAVAAALLQRAIGDNLICVFVDHGLLRKNEGDLVEHTFRDRFHINLIRVNAASRFLEKLSGITDPEEKRKIIGQEFIRVFEEEARKLGKIHALAQGTIYPDVVESGSGGASTIKSHHNVGGLPEVMDFEEIVEPLRELFKDEVRETGLRLGLPRELVFRQPFPGPGLAVRIVGTITQEKLEMLREADQIFREEVEKGSILPSQYFAVLTDLSSVGVMGDARIYGCTVVLRAVTSDDFMTAEWTRLSCDVLERASLRITGEVPGVTRVVYDVTSKPPATVEWE